MNPNAKRFLRILPHIILVASASITLVLLYCDLVSQTFALLMILFILTAYILDQAIESLYFGEKLQNVSENIDRNTSVTELIHDELNRRKDPCELVDPTTKHLWEFEEEMLWYNAPLILAEDEVFDTVRDAYSNKRFRKAKYLFYNGPSEAGKKDYAKKTKRFASIRKRLVEAGGDVARKISARVVVEEAPGFAFFLGKKGGRDECVVYVMEKPFAMGPKGATPAYVFVIREKELINRLRTIFTNEWGKGEALKD